jgi:hypothetical protein
MIDIGTVVALLFASFACGFIDSALGMMYGIILSPVLIIAGFDPLLVIPSVLISQAAGGFSAGVFHHKFGNVNFRLRSPDSRVVYIVTGSGIVATIGAAALAISIPKSALETYIGLLVLALGALLLSKVRFRFSWKRISAVSVIGSFNKGFTGGGFSPVVASGQIIAGRDPKQAIGSTVLAKVPISVAAFLMYVFMRGMPEWTFLLPLSIGAVIAAPFGALLTRRLPHAKLRRGLGASVLLLGIWMLVKVWSFR